MVTLVPFALMGRRQIGPKFPENSMSTISMSNIMKNAVPSSLRKPVESSRFAQGLMARAQKPVLVAGPEARAIALTKSRFERLPQEPEDARMTGVTRSLNRRLLALNVQGSLLRRTLSTVRTA